MSAEKGRFQDRLVLVTGASRGIGEAIAESFAEEGANVAGTSTNQTGVEAINENLGERGFGVLLDLGSDPAEIEAVLDEIVQTAHERRQKLDPEALKRAIEILINNGGTKEKDGPAARRNGPELARVIDVNLRGTADLTSQVVWRARKEDNVRVVTIGSIAAQGHAMQASYSGSKAGMAAYTTSLVGEQNLPGGANSSATFNTIHPGLVDTEIIKSISDEIREKMVAQIPARRIGTPQEIARLVLFLADPDSGYINGAQIPIDGGATAGIQLGGL